MNTQQFKQSLVGLSFTCQPQDRPLQTITVNGLTADGTAAEVTIVSKTTRGNVAQNTTMKLSTLFDRIATEVEGAEPILATVKEPKPAKEPKAPKEPKPAKEPKAEKQTKTQRVIAAVKAKNEATGKGSSPLAGLVTEKGKARGKVVEPQPEAEVNAPATEQETAEGAEPGAEQ